MPERTQLFVRLALFLALSGTSGVVMGAIPSMFPNGLSVIPAESGAYISVTPDNGTVAPPPGGSPMPPTNANWDCLATGSAGSLQTLPAITNGWFDHSGLNAPARPPDSEQVMNHPPSAFSGVTPLSLCGPLEWALHSFLWLTSPTGRDAAPGIAERVFESPIFFDLQADGPQRFKLLQNQAGFVPHLKVRALKPRSGITLEAQTTGGVLMAQPPKGQKYGSLVYYEMSVNDVYAYLVTAVATKTPHVRDAFPTSQAELQPILDFAKEYKLGFAKVDGHSDESVFTLELKTAWVEADLVPTGCKYITRQAVIPTYNTTDPKKWVVSGEKTTKLALVGMHVVGSGGGHPEMIWATFEHICNTPNASFVYEETGNGSNSLNNASESQSTRGDWLFVANGSKGPFNVERITQLSGTDLAASGKAGIGPSDTLRLFPWGNVGNAQNVLNVTQVLLLNRGNPVPSEDLRAWYVLVGAVWTTDGKGPTAPTAPNVTGTPALSNSTMETYIQAEKGKAQNCFLCHNTNKQGEAPGTGMSHIFSSINPLPTEIGTVGANSSTTAPSPFGSSSSSSAATGSGTGSAAPVPGASGSGKARTAGALGAASAAVTLVASEANAAGGFKCTYAVNGIQFVRNTKRPACPTTAAVPANLAAATSPGASTPPAVASSKSAVTAASGGAPTLINSTPAAGGGLVCMYGLNGSTFSRTTHRSQCPATARAPASTSARPTSSRSASPRAPTSSRTSPPPGEGTLVGSESNGTELVCKYKLGNETFTRTTKKSSCPEHARAP